MQSRVKATRVLVVLAATVLSVVALASAPAGAGDEDTDGRDGFVDATNDGDSVDGTATDIGPGDPGTTTRTNGGGPNCTMSDGTPAYLSYEGLLVTTMEEQRTVIRPEEQRPGRYLHVSCGGEYVGFQFVADAEPVDPWVLARTVNLVPPVPVLRTSPAAGDHFVDVDAWFWVDDWQDLSETVSAGDVSVTVTAQPRALVINPGDGSPSFTCTGQPPAYDPAADADGACTHTYQTAGEFTATATLVYDVGFESAGADGEGGDLGTVEPTGSLAVAVSEGQAVVTD